MLTIATSSVVSFFSVWTANCRAGPVPSWFCITFSIPKPVESNIPINSSDFPSQAKPTDSPNSPVESTQIPGWCALGRPLSMWIGKMLMCLGVLVKKTRWENFPQGLESKKWGETSPWKRRWNTKLGINYKQWFWVSILSIFLSIFSKSPRLVALGFHTTSCLSPLETPPFWGKESLAWKMKLFDGIAYGVWKVISRWTVRRAIFVKRCRNPGLLTSQMMNIMFFSFMCWWWLWWDRSWLNEFFDSWYIMVVMLLVIVPCIYMDVHYRCICQRIWDVWI